MDSETGQTRAHARLTYILTGALHQFIETSVRNDKGKGKLSGTGDNFGLDSIVEDAERLLLRAQALAAYALRLDHNNNLIDGEARLGMSAVEVDGSQSHAPRPHWRNRTHKEALATNFTFSAPDRALPSPPLTDELIVTAPSLNQPFQGTFSDACPWLDLLSPIPPSVEATVIASSPSQRSPPNPSGDFNSTTFPPSRLPPPSPSGEAINRTTKCSHSPSWPPGLDEDTVIDPLTGLPALRATGFEPGPSNSAPGPIKPNPFRSFPTGSQSVSHTAPTDTDSNEWWATQKLPVLPPNPPGVSPKTARVSAPSASNPSSSSPLFNGMPAAWSSRPPSYVEFESDNAAKGKNPNHVREGIEAMSGSFKHFLKTMRRRTQTIQNDGDTALAQRLQNVEDQAFVATNLANPFEDPVEKPFGDPSTTPDGLLAQYLLEVENRSSERTSTQSSRSSTGNRRRRISDDATKLAALREEEERLEERRMAAEQLQSKGEQVHQGTMSLQALRSKWAEEDGAHRDHAEIPSDLNAVILASLGDEEERMEADAKVAQALQAEWEEEVRQQDVRTMKELQAKFEEEDRRQHAKLAEKLAAKWQEEDRQELERIREQETTCMICVDRYDESSLFRPCSNEEHIWCRNCLYNTFKRALQTKSRARCCANLATTALPSLDPSFVDQYNMMLLEMDTPNPMYCSQRSCGTFIPPSSVKGDIATCTRCRKRSCVHCKAAEHVGRICSQDEGTQRVLRLAKEQKWKQCPCCQNMIEKVSGCLHMTCSRCHGQFCYHCGQLWSRCRNQCSRGY